MANVNSITTSAASSTANLYGTRNVLSGLASGMDTEAMIENSVSGYKTKISSLEQKQTKIEWKQDAYRAITDKINSLVDKYTSYTSKTNLMSNAFFTGNVSTTASSSAVFATGKSTSDIQINSISSLASAARYSVGVDALDLNGAVNTTGSAIDWNAAQSGSTIAGSTLTLKVGSNTIDLDFGENDKYGDYRELAKGINQKLAEINVSTRKNGTVTADKILEAQAGANGEINFVYRGADGDAAYISGASGKLSSVFGVRGGSLSDGIRSFTIDSGSPLKSNMTTAGYLENKSIDVTLDGVTRSIKMEAADLDFADGATGAEKSASLAEKLQAKLNDAFGTGRVTVSATENGALNFGVAENSGSSLRVSSEVGAALGIGKNGVSNYLNTSKTLGDLLGENYFTPLRAAAFSETEPEREDGSFYVMYDGQEVNVDRAGQYEILETMENGVRKLTAQAVDENGYYLDSDGNRMYEPESLVINGVRIGDFNADSTLESVLSAINNSRAGVSAKFSTMTGEFTFSTQDTGATQKIEFGDGLASRLFTGAETASRADTADSDGAYAYGAGRFQAGTDARLSATVNGKAMELTRSSNVVQMDGMNVTLKDTFNVDGTDSASPISFTSKSDSDTIVDAIRSFVEEYNEIANAIHSAYATQPAEKNSSTHAKYEPLSETDKADMSESAIAKYEEKAKQGLLFGDNDLSSLYNQLTSIVSGSGDERKAMEAIGLTTTYSNGVTTLKLNEDDLRTALENNPDQVRNVFSNASDTDNGLMSKLKSTMNAYASTSYGGTGILVNKAGSTRNSASLLNNTLQKQSDNLQTQIERWQTKMSAKIDYYTRQFTALEKLMSTMNNQSSALAGMMGY